MDFESEFQRVVDADPFLPFDIVVTSGDRFHIADKDQLSIGANFVMIFLPKKDVYFFRKNQMVAVLVYG